MRTKFQQSQLVAGSILLLAFLLMNSNVLHSQTAPIKDMSSFYSITGFNNPLLRSGQYMVSLTPHYYQVSYNSNSNSINQSLPGGSPSSGNSASSGKNSSYDFTIASLYGVSNDVTLNLLLTYSPTQNNHSQHSFSHSSSNSISSDGQNESSGDNDFINSSLIISYRPEKNLELAFKARYSSSTSNGYSSGSSTSSYVPVTTNLYRDSYTDNSPAYDLSVSLVFISN